MNNQKFKITSFLHNKHIIIQLSVVRKTVIEFPCKIFSFTHFSFIKPSSFISKATMKLPNLKRINSKLNRNEPNRKCGKRSSERI